MSTTSPETDNDERRGRIPTILREFWKQLVVLILAPVVVGVAVWHFTRDSVSPVLEVDAPRVELLSRGAELSREHRDPGDYSAEALKQPGVRLVANIKASGHEGDVLAADCWVYDS